MLPMTWDTRCFTKGWPNEKGHPILIQSPINGGLGIPLVVNIGLDSSCEETPLFGSGTQRDLFNKPFMKSTKLSGFS